MTSNVLKAACILIGSLACAAILHPVASFAEEVCTGSVAAPPKISGMYIDNFDGWQAVGKQAWVSYAAGDEMIFDICSVDNTKNFLIARNSADNQYNPGKYSRFEWFGSNGQLFYCQQVFDAASAADAADFTKTKAADSSDANDKGCGQAGQFPWSQLILVAR
ncbi:hypothetical protein [Mesorhizobium sp. M0678]|uniref:hypothetical protein n=1 Tax=unclassified Mesorhizobium TaxID=325217 RepID=UPI0033382652